MSEPLLATTTAEQDRAAADKRMIAAVAEPTTTAEQDRKTAGQRQINIVWEMTQAGVAASVTLTSLYVFARLALIDQWTSTALGMLSNAFFLIVGFYFGRTNHTRSGGVGGEAAGNR